MTNNIQTTKTSFRGLGTPCFKQAWQLIRQHKLFSAIYIAGTALGISMVMVMAIMDYVKTADISPEINRSRMMYVKSIQMTSSDTVRFKYPNSGRLSYNAVKEFLMPLKNVETISIMTSGADLASLPGDDNLVKIKSRFVDANYWRVFNFRFLAGKPFSDADYASGLDVAVITESLAKKFFGSSDVAVGQNVEYGFKPYRVVGVVKDVSYVLDDTYAQIWINFTSDEDYDEGWNERGGMMGTISKVFLLARSVSDFKTINNEVNERVRLYNAQGPEWRADFLGQPDKRGTAINRFASNIKPNMKKIRIQNILIVFLLLLVPAINLSGMNGTRMEHRLSEMGVRKAFGASRSKLVNQVLTENLLLTGLGGLAGLLLSYLVIFFTKNWILDLGKIFVEPIFEGASVNFSMSMLFNLKIFVIVLLACLAMNILSALVPVYRSLRKSITDSLNIKYN